MSQAFGQVFLPSNRPVYTAKFHETVDQPDDTLSQRALFVWVLLAHFEACWQQYCRWNLPLVRQDTSILYPGNLSIRGTPSGC